MTKDPDVCPTCEKGRLVNGVANMPNECCVIYFFGAGSGPHEDWQRFTRFQQALAAKRSTP